VAGESGHEGAAHSRQLGLRRRPGKITWRRFSAGVAEPEVLEAGEGDQREQGVVVQPGPRAALDVIEPQLRLALEMCLPAGPARFQGGHHRLQGGRRGVVGQVVLALAGGAPLPDQPDDLPGLVLPPGVGGPSATRTRTAAKRAASGPLAPRRPPAGPPDRGPNRGIGRVDQLRGQNAHGPGEPPRAQGLPERGVVP
jgi:hypothetical protein